MRLLIGITILLTLKLLGITPTDIGIIFVISLMVGIAMAVIQYINEITRVK
jgi:hypothetical protein